MDTYKMMWKCADEIGIFQYNYVNSIVADDLAPCVASSSAIIWLTITRGRISAACSVSILCKDDKRKSVLYLHQQIQPDGLIVWCRSVRPTAFHLNWIISHKPRDSNLPTIGDVAKTASSKNNCSNMFKIYTWYWLLDMVRYNSGPLHVAYDCN